MSDHRDDRRPLEHKHRASHLFLFFRFGNEASLDAVCVRFSGDVGEIAGIGISARPARVNEEIPEALSLNRFDSN